MSEDINTRFNEKYNYTCKQLVNRPDINLRNKILGFSQWMSLLQIHFSVISDLKVYDPITSTGLMRKIGAFFRYQNIYSNRHFKKTIGKKTQIYHIWVYGQIYCELCRLKLDPLHNISLNFEIRLF